MTLVNDSDGVSTYHLIESYLNGSQQVEFLTLHDILHELHEYLGIGVRAERHSFRLELSFQVSIVLDDTIMDNGKILRLRIMRMRIDGRGLTMGRPSGMCDTDSTADILVTAIFHQIVYLSFCLADIQVTIVINQCDTCRVVTTILQASQTFNQNRESVLLSNISYYSAHTISLVSLCCVVVSLLFYFFFGVYLTDNVGL